MALFVIGLFGVLVIFANSLSNIIKESIELHVYIDYNMDEKSQQQVLKQIYSQEYIAMKAGKKQIFYISKEEAAKKFIKETGEDFIKFLGDNPLRDAYVVKIKQEYSEKAKLRQIKEDLENIDGIFEVVYIESIVDAINENIAKISLILISFALILIFVVFILINSSLRLALYSQRFLIRSMQLVGATSFFIQRPFLLRAFLHGILSGVLASALLFGLMQYGYSQIPEIKLLENQDQLIILALSLLLFGGLLGFISTFQALNRYLKMSLEELY